MKRILLTAALALASAAACPASSLAIEPDDGVIITNIFDAHWSVEVDYQHRLAEPKPVTRGEHAKFTLSGTLPGLEFEDDYLLNSASRPVNTPLTASVLTWLQHPEGTSDQCDGDSATAKGFAVLGREAGGVGTFPIWFAPIVGAEFKTTCRDSDGKTHPGAFSISSVSRAPGGPAGSWTRVTPTLALVDQPRWELPVRISVSGADCPDWDAAYSTSCELSVTGKVTFERTLRRADIDLLQPAPPQPATEQPKPPRPKVSKPKLDRGARKLRGSVTCQRGCSIGIGIFAHRKNGTPYVKPVKQRSVTVKGGGAAKLTVGLSKAQLATLRKGKRATVTMTVSMDGVTTTEQYTIKP